MKRERILTAYITPELHQKIKVLAEREQRSISIMVSILLENCFKHDAKEGEINVPTQES